ncbi:hypothetical protein KI387_044634, partial [Taxus chinensis]
EEIPGKGEDPKRRGTRSNPSLKEKSPEEAEKAGSPTEELPLRKKQRIEEEADSEEIESLERYIGEKDDDEEEDDNEEDDPERDQEPH